MIRETTVSEPPETVTTLKRRKPMSNDAALAYLVRAASRSPGGVFAAPNIAALGAQLGWERSRTGKAVKFWEGAGKISVVRSQEGVKITAPVREIPAAVPREIPADFPAPFPADFPALNPGKFPREIPAAGNNSSAVPREITPVPPVIPVASATAPAPDDRPGLDAMNILLLGGAAILASFSILLSVLGFAAMLPGWAQLAMAIGAAIELVRLIIVGAVARAWREIAPVARWLMLGLVLVAEVISAIGVFSELETLHAGNRPIEVATRQAERAAIDARIERQQAVVADIDARIAAMDRSTGSLVDGAGRRGKVLTGREIMTSSGKERAALADQRQRAAEALVTLKIEAAGNTAQSAVADAALGPAREISALVGGYLTDAGAARAWLIAIMVLMGPAASVLVAAAGSRRRR